LGGFFDGIVFHQILGWHHLICTSATCQAHTVAELKRQDTQDGFFHLAVWILTIIGVVMLSRAAQRQAQRWSGRALAGAMLAGWGAFNFVEGVIDHQILGIHHVLPGHRSEFLFDMLFLASGAFLAVLGWFMARAEYSASASHA
jgi:uncharacterized membrane protein